MNPNQIQVANVRVAETQWKRDASKSRLLARLRRR
jgi:hypothetical protein